MKKQNGASLIEVMVSLMILSIGILGMMMLQLTSIQSTRNSVLRTEASYEVHTILEELRADPSYTNDNLRCNPNCVVSISWQENGIKGNFTLETNITKN